MIASISKIKQTYTPKNTITQRPVEDVKKSDMFTIKEKQYTCPLCKGKGIHIKCEVCGTKKGLDEKA